VHVPPISVTKTYRCTGDALCASFNEP
jgi:hypothetical protein